MAPSDRDGSALEQRREEGKVYRSDRRRRSPFSDSEEDSHRTKRDERRRRSPDHYRSKDRSRDQSPGRRTRRDRSRSQERLYRSERRDHGRDHDDRPRRRHGDEEDRRPAQRHKEDEGRGPVRRKRSPDSRSRSPPPRRHERKASLSDSPPPKRRRHSPSPPARRARGALASQEASFRGNDSAAATGTLLDADGKPLEKQKPNFNSTGLLAKEANTIAGTDTVLKYHEPAEARKPPASQSWRIYVFKGKDTVDDIHLFMRSCWLIGRHEKVADYHIQHPSASKQHAVIQFRYITKTNEFGERQGKVKPYLIDLESANGTKLNGKKVEPSKYVELLDGDIISFGESEREYVLMLPPP